MSLASDGTRAVALVSGAQRTIWSSTDGRAWKQDLVFPADASPNEVAGGLGGFIIVGQRETGAMTFVASTWTSPDGHTWTQHDPPTATPTTEGVVIGQDGTAVLMSTCMGPSKLQPTEAVCGGTLRNGTWTAASSPSFTNGVFGDLAVGPGGFLAVGQVRGEGIPNTGAVWTSTDGLTWDRATPDSFASLLFVGAAVTPSGMVALGSTLGAVIDTHPKAFRSTDGKTWTSLPGVPDVLRSGGVVGRLRAAGGLPDGRLVVGGIAVTTSPKPQMASLLLVLAGKRQWEAVPQATAPISEIGASANFEIESVVVLGNRVLAGGADADGAVIWVGEPET